MKKSSIIVIILLTLAVAGIAFRVFNEPQTPSSDQEALVKSVMEVAPSITGMITYGDEVRSFVPCGTYEGDPAWMVLADAGVAANLRMQYEANTEERMPYTPLLATITAQPIDPPSEGFGADYSSAFYVSQIQEIFPTQTCLRDEALLESPLSGSTISSPLAISGLASGAWMFEGSMTAVLTNWDGEIISETILSAEGDWMTEELVPFTGIMEFEQPEYGARGSLIIQASNPSGLPENQKNLEIQISFSELETETEE